MQKKFCNIVAGNDCMNEKYPCWWVNNGVDAAKKGTEPKTGFYL